MLMMSGTRLSTSAMTMAESARMGYRLSVDPTVPEVVMHRAMRDCDAAMKTGKPALPIRHPHARSRTGRTQ